MARITSVLLDRDGTIIEDKHYLADPAGVELLPGATEGLRRLVASGIRTFVVTNQSGIGRGYFSEEDYHACHAAMAQMLNAGGAPLADAAFCPHAPDVPCECRKPSPGMWFQLAAKHGLTRETAVMVGDKDVDILFGRNAGLAGTVLVLTGNGLATAEKMNLPLPGENEPYRVIREAALPGGERLPHAVARDLTGAARFILDE